MSKLRIFTTTAITLALAFGIWTFAAVNFTDTSSSFTDGDVLQASDLNALFNDIDTNFQDAETQINQNETDIGTNASDISDLQSDKVDVAGDDMDGQLRIQGDMGASDSNPDGGAAALFAENSNSSGVSAFIRNQGDQPALYVKQIGTGPILEAVSTNSGNGVRIRNNGDVALDGGTVTNESGDPLLPVAYGSVNDATPGGGVTLSNSTSNVSGASQTSAGNYVISLDDVTLTNDPVVTATALNSGPADEIVTYDVDTTNDELLINVADSSGSGVVSDFTFVLHQP